jgi:Mannosyltransferase (PIG-V)
MVVEHTPADTAEAAPPPLRPRRRWRWAGIPLGIYAASRLVQLALIAWMLPPGGASIRSRLLAWDAGWFVRVAQDGYEHGYTYSGGTLVGNGLAFFPGYPLLIRAVHEVTRLDYETAALTLSWVAGAVAAVLVYALGRRLYDSRVAVALAVLFCAQPMSVVLSMAYSEGLFVALVAATLLAAHRRSWVMAGALGLAAALTRPTGAALAIGLGIAAVIAVRERRPDRWRAVAAAAVALLGVPAYLCWVGQRVGSWHAWFDIQTAGWGSTFDFGLGALRFVLDALRTGDGWIEVSVALILIAAVVTAIVAVTRRVWPPLLGYGLIALFLVLGQNGYYHSKPRLLVPVLIVLVPPALALARARPRTAALVLTGYALFGLWYGAYLITVWRFAI